MSDLPDLDTSEAAYIAYWNAIEQGGVSTIEASEALSDTNIEEYTLYDNGAEGTTTCPTDRIVNFRIKDDGWIVAWMDDSSATPTAGSEFTDEDGNVDYVYGLFDIVNDWSWGTGTTSIVENSLERVIESLASELSNWDTISYDPEDVGLYSYAYPDATATTLFSERTPSDSETYEHGFLYTAGTDILYAAITGHADGGDYRNDQYVRYLDDGDIEPQVVLHQDGSGQGSSAMVLDNPDWMADDGVEYLVELEADDSWDAWGSRARGDALLIWEG